MVHGDFTTVSANEDTTSLGERRLEREAVQRCGLPVLLREPDVVHEVLEAWV